MTKRGQSMSARQDQEHAEVVEDFESRPQKVVTFVVVERNKEMQELRKLKMPQALPRYSGEKPGRSKAEGEKEAKKEKEKVRRVEKEVMNVILTTGPIDSTTSGGVADVVEEMENVERGSGGDVAEELFQHVGHCWDCSQVENQLEERREDG